MAKPRHRRAVAAVATVLGFAAPMTLYAAGLRYLDPAETPADAMPAYEIVTRARDLALEPAGAPVRRGPYYVMDAYDGRGVALRVVADAQSGDILSVAPVRPLAATPPPGGGPRIIHVPDPGGDASATPPPAERDAAPPGGARDGAPKAGSGDLTPIYPTPKFSREDKAEKFTAPPPVSAPVARD